MPAYLQLKKTSMYTHVYTVHIVSNISMKHSLLRKLMVTGVDPIFKPALK